MTTIITKDPVSSREFRLSDARRKQWFSHYGEDGSGFGYLSFILPRQTGYDHKDIGYGFEVWLWKGLTCLFHGQIVRITEQTGEDGDGIEVWVLGWVHVTEANRYNYVYCDTRVGEWESETESDGSFKPDLFDWYADEDEGLTLTVRENADLAANDYLYVKYEFEFGEVAARLVCDYDVAMPVAYPGKVEIRDGDGNVLWSVTASETGSLDLTTSGSPTSLEIRFYVTAAGTSTANIDSLYATFSNLKVYSVNVTTLDAEVVAEDLVDLLDDQGLSSSKSQISSPGLALEPAVFEGDPTPAQILTWCCKFGDSSGQPLAWGVTFDDTKRLFLETMDLDNVRYWVKARPRRMGIERSGDWGESAQKAYAVYTNAGGTVVRTSDEVRQTVIDRFGGYFRRVGISLEGNLSAAQAANALDLWLDENEYPAISGSFMVFGGVNTPSGRFVPFDELTPGGLVQVREWRAREAAFQANDYRDNATTFLLAGAKVDEDQQSVELIPRQTSDAFARHMAIISELQRGQ